jgi:hypothetical protein
MDRDPARTDRSFLRSHPRDADEAVGQHYTITIDSYKGYQFDHWDDGTTNPTSTIVLTASTVISASFR